MKLYIKYFASFVVIFTSIFIGYALFNGVGNWHGLLAVSLSGGLTVLIILGVISYRISRKFMGFVELAERIFTVFGWKDVKNIDLPAISKKNKKPGDPAALGTLFFRY